MAQTTASIGSKVDDRTRELYQTIRRSAPREAARRLADEQDDVIADVLEHMHPPQALGVLDALPSDRATKIRALVDEDDRERWAMNEQYGAGTVGHVMERPGGVFAPETTVREAVERLREEVKKAFITYIYITDPENRLVGLVVMREMLLADETTRMSEIMLKDPFSLKPEETIEQAMRETVDKHFPVYPVCDGEGKLLGLLRGDDLFEQNVFQLVVQAGSMVGVEREERITTTWTRALRLRHPWLLVNLVTAFVAGGVVSLFSDTIDKIVVLAAFLPVLAGQSGNTGCQSLAVTLRGLTLGDFAERPLIQVVSKEALLGVVNGAIIGVIAGTVMFFYSSRNGAENPLTLGLVVWMAMTGSCMASGVTGTLVPVILKKLGADPATASSIFLTTATDVVSMGLMLGLASILLI
jgi:magnesium transporter